MKESTSSWLEKTVNINVKRTIERCTTRATNCPTIDRLFIVYLDSLEIYVILDYVVIFECKLSGHV